MQRIKIARVLFHFLTLSALFLLIPSCSKEVDPIPERAPYAYGSLDPNGGSWRPILLSSASELALEAPLPVNSAEYQAELAALKSASAALRPDQEEAVQFWGANALVRWNEIARELAAKYNLPPAANPDGTYPAPSAQNPGVYPYFPFANPPYASRMFAYWSAAQFDALIAAWHYKYTYQRPAPYLTDPTIIARLPENTLPSYPSEDAVMAAVSQKILTAMFPLEADYIQKQAEEHLNSRRWAGVNTDSDLAAGKALGEAVAAKFLARASTDGMKNVLGNAAIQDSMRQAAENTFGWSAWHSLEGPPRPGMLMLFGWVKPWCIPNVASVRPPVPPAVGSDVFNAQVAELKRIADNLTPEQRRIANFWADGPSTYTPPGHWNRIAAELIFENQLNPLRTARIFAYMNMAVADAGISCWDAKYYYCYPRPSQVIPGFRSLLGVPNFPSYTSGHSTFSAAAAATLSAFFPQRAAELEAKAREASESRIYGGIHYRFDCEEGLKSGRSIGDYAIEIARMDGADM